MNESLRLDETYRSALTYSEAVQRFINDLRRKWPEWRFSRVDLSRDTESGEWEARAYAESRR